jgi:hypothetical protein
LQLIHGGCHQLVHGAANLVIRLVDIVGIKVCADLAENVLITRLFEVSPDNFLGIFFNLRAFVSEKPCSPEAQQLVATCGCLEPQLLVMREFVFKSLLALVECAHASKSPMNRRRRIYEGKAKILYEGPEPGTLIQFFKDDATAFNNKKHDVSRARASSTTAFPSTSSRNLNRIGIPTHFIRRLNMREQLIREVEIIPLEVVVRNVAAGSIAKRLGIEEGTVLPRSIIEFYYKADALDDPMVSEEHITAFGWASPQEIDDIMALAIRVNDFLSGLFLGIGIQPGRFQDRVRPPVRGRS